MSGAAEPEVDVCVVTYGTRDLSVTALRRLLDDTTGVQLRLLVRDNGSTDGTAAALAAAVPEAEIEAGTENLGFAAGVNRLLRRTTAPWVLLLNSDAWPEADAVARMVRAGERDDRAAAVAPRLLRPDGDREHSPLPFPTAAAALGRPGRRDLLPGAEPTAGPVDWAVGAALLLRAEAVADVGPLDERYFFYGEDLAWCWAAHRRGWHVRYEPAAVVRHVGGASTTTTAAERGALVWRATYAFCDRSYPWWRTAAFRAANVVAAGRRWATSRGDVGLRAYWRAELAAHLRRRT